MKRPMLKRPYVMAVFLGTALSVSAAPGQTAVQAPEAVADNLDLAEIGVVIPLGDLWGP